MAIGGSLAAYYATMENNSADKLVVFNSRNPASYSGHASGGFYMEGFNRTTVTPTPTVPTPIKGDFILKGTNYVATMSSAPAREDRSIYYLQDPYTGNYYNSVDIVGTLWRNSITYTCSSAVFAGWSDASGAAMPSTCTTSAQTLVSDNASFLLRMLPDYYIASSAGSLISRTLIKNGTTPVTSAASWEALPGASSVDVTMTCEVAGGVLTPSQFTWTTSSTGVKTTPFKFQTNCCRSTKVDGNRLHMYHMYIFSQELFY